ncbi:hypothetical protein WA171_001593 [Blastocystis sp. BT1]
MIPGLVACYYSMAGAIPYEEDWYYSNMAESCTSLKILDLIDEFDSKELKHTWPGLDDRIETYFSGSITGYLNIGPSADYVFHITCERSVILYFDTATTPLIYASVSGTHTATIYLTTGRHLMRLYFSSGDSPRLLVQYSSPAAGLPLTTIDDTVTFVGGMAPSLQEKDITTFVSGTIETTRPCMRGSYITSFTVSPPFPVGISINSVSGVISGSSSLYSSMDYVITASGPLGSVATTIHVTVGIDPVSGLNAKYYQLRSGQICSATYFSSRMLIEFADTVDASIYHPELPLGHAWSPIPHELFFRNFYVKWRGFIEVDISGDYVFKLENRDGARMMVMGNLLINNWKCADEMITKEGSITFNRKGYYPIQVEYFAISDTFGMMLTWKRPGDESFVAVPDSKLSHIPDGSFTYTTQFTHYYQNVKIPPNSPVFVGVILNNPVFTSDPELPPGLKLTDGSITGTPSERTAKKTYVITARSGGLSLSTKIVFDVSYVAPPTRLSIKGEDGEEVNEVIVEQFTDMAPLILECNYAHVSWSIEPDLPLGMSIDHKNNRIKGWPKASLSRTRFTVSASNSGGSVQKILYITVTGCEYGQYLYTPNVPVMGGLLTVTKDNDTIFEQFVNNTEYNVVLCIPKDNYNISLMCYLPQQVPCFFILRGEDGLTYTKIVLPGRRGATTALSTNVTKKPLLSLPSSKNLRVRERFSISITISGVYSPLVIEPSLPSGVTLSDNVLSGAFMDQGTFIFTISTSNQAGEDEKVIEFDVGTCPDNQSLLFLSRSNGRKGESLIIYTMSGEVVLSRKFSGEAYEQALCMANAEYRVVMNTTLSSGSWGVGEELLIRDSWNDLLASMSLSDGSGEAVEYFTINYVLLDDQLMRYSSASGMNEEWNSLDFKDSDWSIGSSGGFGHFRRNTVYFRREFIVDNKNKYPIFAFDLEVLDGIIAYINGIEVVRRNMPMSEVNENTLAIDRYDQLIWHRTSIPSTLLENGRNVLAVELHRYGESSDTRIYFDMYASLLSGTCMLRTDRGYATDSHHSLNLENPPSAAFDGDLETSWRENNLPVFIQFNYNYDRFESINKVVLRGTIDYSHQHPKRFEIIGMISEEEGDVLAQVDDRNIFTEPQSSVAVVFPNNKSYNGYQVRIEETNDESIYVSIAEVELYTCHFVYCPKEKGWDSIMTGEISYGTCPQNSFGESTRYCLKNGFDPVWGKVDQSTCLSIHPSSSVAFIDFKYMISSCTIKNYDIWVYNRLIDVISDRLLVSKHSINIFLKRDCSDSETKNVCFNVRITTHSKVVDYVSKQIVALQQDISYLIYKDAPVGFPSGMYFVMVMNPIVRKPVSVSMVITIVVYDVLPEKKEETGFIFIL